MVKTYPEPLKTHENVRKTVSLKFSQNNNNNNNNNNNAFFALKKGKHST